MNEDNYEHLENDINLKLKSVEWVIQQADKLIEEYRNCRTENCKRLAENKLRSIFKRMNYENKILETIIKKGKDEGLEL